MRVEWAAGVPREVLKSPLRDMITREIQKHDTPDSHGFCATIKSYSENPEIVILVCDVKNDDSAGNDRGLRTVLRLSLSSIREERPDGEDVRQALDNLDEFMTYVLTMAAGSPRARA